MPNRRFLLQFLRNWLILFVCFWPAAVFAENLSVFAAASLKNAIDDVSAEFRLKTGLTVVASLAASSTLAQQIRRGAPADVFMSANTAWMDKLEGEGLLQPGTRFNLLTNAIVLIEHGRNALPFAIGPDMGLEGRLGRGPLAMALVDAAPAGIYGKSALKSLGHWDAVKALVAQTDNVRAALTLVSSGAAPMGIVFATDAMASDNVTILGTFPSRTHPPIIYPVAVLASSSNPAAARFSSFLRKPDARTVFERHGFVVVAR